MYLFFLTASNSLLDSKHFLMFSGKKSGRLVFTTYVIVLTRTQYIEQEVSVNEFLVTNFREVLAKFSIIVHLTLKLCNCKFRKSWNFNNLQLRVK